MHGLIDTVAQSVGLPSTFSEESPIYFVTLTGPEEGQEGCARREFIAEDEDEEKRVINDREEPSPEKISRERAQGSRDRDTARTINGVLQAVPCADGLRCMEDRCIRREPSE